MRAAAATEVANARKEADEKRQQYAAETADARKKSIDEIGSAQKEAADGVQKVRQEAASAIAQTRDNETKAIAEIKNQTAAEIGKAKSDAAEIINGENKKIDAAKQAQITENQKLTQLIADVKSAAEELKKLKESIEKSKKKE
jgi:hypothetical protein